MYLLKHMSRLNGEKQFEGILTNFDGIMYIRNQNKNKKNNVTFLMKKLQMQD